MSRRSIPTLAEVVREVKSSGGIVVAGTLVSEAETPGNAEPDGTLITSGSFYIAATASTIVVTQSFYGDAAIGDTIVLHQVGAPHEFYADIPKLGPVKADSPEEYLVYLQPFIRNPSKPTGQYVVLGFDAVWKKGDNGTFGWIGTEGAGVSYPAELDTAAIEKTLE